MTGQATLRVRRGSKLPCGRATATARAVSSPALRAGSPPRPSPAPPSVFSYPARRVLSPPRPPSFAHRPSPSTLDTALLPP